MAGNGSRCFLRRKPRCDFADGVLLSGTAAEWRRCAAAAGMRSTLACAATGAHAGYRSDVAGWHVCAGSYAGARSDDRASAGVSRAFTSVFPVAAPIVAHRRVGAEQSVVRRGGVAGAAGGGGFCAAVALNGGEPQPYDRFRSIRPERPAQTEPFEPRQDFLDEVRNFLEVIQESDGAAGQPGGTHACHFFRHIVG